MKIERVNNYQFLGIYLDSQMTYINTSIIYRINYHKLYIYIGTTIQKYIC